MMPPNRFFQILFLAGALSCLYFGVRFGSDWHSYSRLQGTASGRATQWEIAPVGDRFAIQAVYTFAVKEKIWRGISQFKNKLFLNEISAYSSLKDASKKDLMVYYDLKDPAVSALERTFPAGFLIRTLLSAGVTIYFFYLFRKISRVDLLH